MYHTFLVRVNDFGPLGGLIPKSSELHAFAVFAATPEEAQEALMIALVQEVCDPDEVGEVTFLRSTFVRPPRAEKLTPSVFVLDQVR